MNDGQNIAKPENIIPLFSEKEIKEKVKELSNAINDAYADCEELTILIVMKGAFLFASDLVRAIKIPIILDFIELSSYGNARTSSGKVVLKNDHKRSFADRDILIIEDIVDTGKTLQWLLDYLKQHKAKSVKIATLLIKNKNQQEIIPEYIGFSIENQFAVGYGLDINEKYRNLSYIGYLP